MQSTIDKEKQEIKEFVSIVQGLTKADRAILLANANAFKVRNTIEKLNGEEKN